MVAWSHGCLVACSLGCLVGWLRGWLVEGLVAHGCEEGFGWLIPVGALVFAWRLGSAFDDGEPFTSDTPPVNP